MPNITAAELEVMKVLWEFGEATGAQIVTALEHFCRWNPKTIQTLIARLVRKNAVSADKNARAFVYRPLVDETAYRVYAFNTLRDHVFNGSISLMFSTLLADGAFSAPEIERLKELLGKAV